MRYQILPAAVRRPRKLIGIVGAIALVVSPLALQAAPAYAVNTGSISGTGSYSTGQSGGPIDPDSITLKSGNTVVATTTSDDNGDYTFTGLADGTYTVNAATPHDLKPAAPLTETVTGGAAVTGADFHFVPVSVAGYWMTASDGGVFAYGDAAYYGSMGGKPLNAPIVGIAGSADSEGYYLVASDGGVFAFGDAVSHGSMGGKPLNSPIVGITLSENGDGYYLVAADGGVFAFGDATYAGSMGGKHLNSPIVGITSILTGGYDLVAADGGIFAYGGAGFYGSAGSLKLNKPIVGITQNFDGGYYLVASDGGVFAYGAPFHGSAGGLKLNKPVVGIDIASDNTGYTMVGSDGGVFSYPAGGVENYGSAASLKLASPIVGIWTI